MRDPMTPWFLDHFDGVTGRDPKYRAACPLCGKPGRFYFIAGDDRWVAGCHGARGNSHHVREALDIVNLRFDDLLYESEWQRQGRRPPATNAPAGRETRGAASARSVREGDAGSVPEREPTPSTSVDRQPVDFVDSQGELEELLELQAQGRLGAVPSVELPALPRDATEAVRSVAQFFAHVHAVREWAGLPREVMFSSHWVAAKLGLPQPTVWRALRRLVKAGVLEDAGQREGRDGKRGPRLYAPGAGAEAAERTVTPRDALPPRAGGVKADAGLRGEVDERQEVGEDVAVRQAIADDGREVAERHGGLSAAGDDADAASGGGLVGHGSPPGGAGCPPNGTGGRR